MESLGALQYLNVSHNELHIILAGKVNVCSKLNKTLEVIDLSYNTLALHVGQGYYIILNCIKFKNTYLRNIYLRKFRDVVDAIYHKSLRTLDLSYNFIPSISVRQYFSKYMITFLQMTEIIIKFKIFSG